MKVSFDYDGTLERESVQKYAAELISRGLEVWVVTSRFDIENYAKQYFTSIESATLANRDLFEVTAKLEIPADRIHFTNMMNKWRFFEGKDFIWHLDDDWLEIREIDKARSRRIIKTRGISYFNSPNWKSKCEKTILRNDNHLND